MTRLAILVPAALLALAACGDDSSGTGGDGGGGGGGGDGGNGGGSGGDNTAPLLDIVGDREVTAGHELSILLGASDADVDDLLAYSADGTVGPNNDPFSADSPAVFDVASHTFTWTPAGTDVGLYSVLFRVTDDGDPPLASNQTITITVIGNQAPTLYFTTPDPEVPPPFFMMTVGRPLRRYNDLEAIEIWATDLDGDAVTVTADGTVGPHANPFTATNPPVWDPVSGSFAWTPDGADDGCYSVEFTATDDGTPMMTDSQLVTFVVEPNYAPYFVDPKTSLVVSADDAISFAYEGRDNNEPDNVTPTGGAVDPGGASDPLNIGVEAFANFDAGLFVWEPTAAWVRPEPYEIWVTVTDDSDWTASETILVDITVVDNAPPVLEPIGDRVVEADATLSFVVRATDPDNLPTPDVVTLSASGTAITAGASFDPASGVFSWTPTAADIAGSPYAVQLTATDDAAPVGSSAEIISISVVDAPTAAGRVVISEVDYATAGAQFVELANLDAHTIDLAGWELCGGTACVTLPALTIAPGGLALIAWDHVDAGADFSADAAVVGVDPCELGRSFALYDTAGHAGGGAAQRAFVQWLTTGQPNEAHALSADPPRWKTGRRVLAGDGSICFAGGDPSDVDAFVIDATPTPGMDNAGCL